MNKKETLSIIRNLEEQKEMLEMTILRMKASIGAVSQGEISDYLDELMTNFYKKPTQDKYDCYLELNNNLKNPTEDDILEDMKNCIK